MTGWSIASARCGLVPFVVAVAQFGAGHARAAEGETCSGPPACCPAELAEDLKADVTVSVGVVLSA